MGVGIEFFSSDEKIRTSKSDVLIYSGAGYEARTRYLHLGKVALYQMSYGRTFHLFLPVCCPATLVIIPHTPAVVNHKFTFF